MKTRKYPYDITYIKNYIISKKYTDAINFTHYKKILKYLYPDLTNYYLRVIMLDLVECGFLQTNSINRRRYFYINKEVKEDIGFMTFD